MLYCTQPGLLLRQSFVTEYHGLCLSTPALSAFNRRIPVGYPASGLNKPETSMYHHNATKMYLALPQFTHNASSTPALKARALSRRIRPNRILCGSSHLHITYITKVDRTIM